MRHAQEQEQNERTGEHMEPKEITEKHLTASAQVDLSAVKTDNFLEQARQAKKAFQYAAMYTTPNFSHPASTLPTPSWVPSRLLSGYYRVDQLGRDCLEELTNDATRVRVLEWHIDWALVKRRVYPFEYVAQSVTNIRPSVLPFKNDYLSDWSKPDNLRPHRAGKALEVLRYGAPMQIRRDSITTQDIDKNLILLMACGAQTYGAPQYKQSVVDAAFALAAY